jgi:hypothetical protein
MYFAFNNDFINQWNHPEYVEKKRKQEEEKRQQQIMKMNMESLEKCIKRNAIDDLDRTKRYDKTFICSNFISTNGHFMYDDTEMKNFANNMKPKINELGIEYTDETDKIFTTDYMCSKRYKFWSNVIPKNTFTNIGNSLVFRISDDITEDNVKANLMQHSYTVPCDRDDHY